MCTILTHSLIGATVVYTGKPRVTPKDIIIGAALGSLPDADSVFYYLGAPDDSMFGHRGITHSIFFAVVVGICIAIALRRSGFEFFTTALAMFGACVSHPLCDMCTDGGWGVALLAPFSNARLISPVILSHDSPMIDGFFSAQGMLTLLSEFTVYWIPIGAVMYKDDMLDLIRYSLTQRYEPLSIFVE